MDEWYQDAIQSVQINTVHEQIISYKQQMCRNTL